MTWKVHATYRNGVFLPSTPPPVADGTEVELIVTAGAPGSEHIRPTRPTVTLASRAAAHQLPKRKPISTFLRDIFDWPGERDEKTMNLAKRLQNHFESHLIDAKEARVADDLDKQDRFLQAALLFQLCVFEGCVSLLYHQYCPQDESKTARPNKDKIECLCALAKIKKPFLRYRDIRDGLSHARSDSVPDKMPTPEEIEADAILMDEFFRRLDSILR
jgi:hypothetical protein